MSDHQPSGASFQNASPNLSRPAVRLPSHSTSDLQEISSTSQYDYQSPTGVSQGISSPFHPQQPQQLGSAQPRANQQNTARSEQNQIPRFGTAINMASLAAALPDAGYALPNYGQQTTHRYPGGLPNPTAMLYQMQQPSQYTGQPVTPSSSYNSHHPAMYGTQPPQQHALALGASHGQQFFSNPSYLGPHQVQQIGPYFYSHGQFSPQSQQFSSGSYAGHYTNRSNVALEGGLLERERSNERMNPNIGQALNMQGQLGGTVSSLSQSSIARGPPRKPKQSGHALWVGNLPPGANVIDLKDHFSRDATDDILSVFLISKSNCAFVNYKTEASCAAAMNRFHDSRFQGVRLVCRLRRTSVNSVSGVPTGPAALSSQQSPVVHTPLVDGEKSGDGVNAMENDNSDNSPAKDKYFIVKSLTVEDLESSVRNGVWATQSHNEEALNKAYEVADSVYLIFSANKSGEYFGYGRMISRINEDPAAAIEFAPKAQEVQNSDLPKAIQTDASEFAPKGRIIDDSARGTIFWEAEVDDASGAADGEDNRSEHSDAEGEPSSSSSKAWGKPFKIEWMATNRLPFYRTRGLRNPWNSNREVKIARDGTELETSVGQRLVAMFHRDPSAVAQNLSMPMPMPMMGGYPHGRPY